MKFLKPTFTLLIFTLFITGCAQKLHIKAIKSASVTDDSIKNIAVANFKSDKIGQSSFIDSKISNIEIDGKKYFNLIDRENLNKILEEKELTDSGLIELVKGHRNKGLAQVQALVTGEVTVSTISSRKYKEERVPILSSALNVLLKSKAKIKTYLVTCKSNTYTVNSKIKVTRVSDAKILFTNNYEKEAKHSACSDSNKTLPSKKEQNSKLAQLIAKDFIKEIAPSYIYFQTTLMDSADISYTNKDEALLENALELIKNNRIEKANTLLRKLNSSTRSKSYVALYNLGITEESLGNLEDALVYYNRAEEVHLENGFNEDISESITRVQNNIKEANRAKIQIN